MIVSGVSQPKRWRLIEPWLVALSLILLFALNLVTSSRFPLPWQDEDLFSDPAINLATHHGFVSSVYFCGVPTPDPMDHLWSCNVPGFEYLLGHWIMLFGFSIRAVRSLNYVLFSLAVLVLWFAVRRLQLIPRPWGRLIFLLLILSGYSMGFIFRSARYDCLAMLLVSLALLSFSIPSRPLRLLSLALLGILFPISAMQLLSYCFLQGIILLAFFRGKVFWEILALGIGMVAGIGILFRIFSAHGVLQNFFADMASEGIGRVAYFSKDPSTFLLLLSCLLLAIAAGRSGTFHLRSPVGFGLVCGLVIPLGMVASRKFPIYYSWMAYVPLALCVAITLSEVDWSISRISRSAAVACVLGACLLGFPVQLASAAWYWNDRDTSRIDALLQGEISGNDWVYSDYSAYFAVRRLTPHVFIPYVIPAQYGNNVTVLVVSPSAFAEYAHAIVGGDWYDTGRSITPSRHDFLPNSNFAILLQRRIDLHVYKRSASPH